MKERVSEHQQAATSTIDTEDCVWYPSKSEDMIGMHDMSETAH